MTPVVIGGFVIFAVLCTAIIVTRLIRICGPNRVLIFYGRGEKGYRLIQGGRGVRFPLIEQVAEMDLTNMIIDIRVTGAYSKGGIPLNVEGVANVKVASMQPTLGNAIERFLDKKREEIMNVARETLEGNLRGVLATLTPEEVNQDRVKFADSLLHEADVDLRALGLELDTLKIQHVSDDKGYLDSIGRKQSATLIMTSRIAEAENKTTAAQRSADNVMNQEIAKVVAQIAEAEAEAKRRIVDAESRGKAMVAEERGKVVSAVARARAELKVQEARMSQVRLQLLADQIKPAEAERERMEEAARGDAAHIIEEGKATAEALRTIAETWMKAGDSARQIFVAQKLSALVGSMMSTVDNTTVDKITMIDSKLGNGGSNMAVNAAVTSEQLKHTLGVDLPALLRKLGAKSEDGRFLAADDIKTLE